MPDTSDRNTPGWLEEDKILVADGGMGTALFALGLDNGDSPELWNIDFPDRIAGVHRAYVEAGADIILTNTFGGSATRLARHGLRDRCGELNGAATRIALGVAAEADRRVLVAGSIGPTGDLMAPLGELTIEEGIEIFSEQAEALVEAGVDLLWIETMYSIEELTTAFSAATRFEVPIITTMSFDSHGHTMMGVPPRALADWWSRQDPRPIAVGANCGIGPSEALHAVSALLAASPDAIAVAKSNCGAPALQGLDVTYPIGPGGMRTYTEVAIDVGIRIIGACCGSNPDHIRVIRDVIDGYEKGASPTPGEIKGRLSEVEAGSVG